MPSNIQVRELLPGAAAEVIAAARALLLDYGRFVQSEGSAAHFCFGSLEKEAATLPAGYAEQGGGCALAFVDAAPAGFVAWRQAPGALAATAWEMKRLWVPQKARGLGLGRLLTDFVLQRARAAGRTAVYLDTVPATMSAAVRLYRELGFQPCAPYAGTATPGVEYLVNVLH